MFPLHVVDVPGYSLHCVYGIKHYIVALCVLVKVIFYFLKQKKQQKTTLIIFIFFSYIHWNKSYFSDEFLILFLLIYLYTTIFP